VGHRAGALTTDTPTARLTLCGRAYTVRRMRSLLLAGVSLLSVRSAAAQTIDVDPFALFVGSNGTLTAAFAEPQGPNARLDCVVGDNNCQPLNKSICDTGKAKPAAPPQPAVDAGPAIDPRPIAVSLNPGSGTVPPGSILVIWVEKEGTVSQACTTPYAYRSTTGTAQANNASQNLITQRTLASAIDLNQTFPNSTTNFDIAAEDFLNGNTTLFGAVIADNCKAQGGTYQFYRLCFGIDLFSVYSGGYGTTAMGTIEANEPQAWVRILVDPWPPANITEAKAQALDGRLGFSAISGAPARGDHWHFVYHTAATPPDPATAAQATLDAEATRTSTFCANINESAADFADLYSVTDIDAAGNPSPELPASNGVFIEGCLGLVDEAGNRGSSAYFSGKPINECDFIECFPGDLRGGYCGATLGPGFAALVCAALLLRAVRRRDARPRASR